MHAQRRMLQKSKSTVQSISVSLCIWCYCQMPKGWCCELGQLKEKTQAQEVMDVRKTKKGAALRRWFQEKWVDVRTGKPCGRRKGEKRGVPYCRPSKRVSSKTPKTSGEMSSSEKRKKIREKKRLGQPAGKPRRVSAARRKRKKK